MKKKKKLKKPTTGGNAAVPMRLNPKRRKHRPSSLEDLNLNLPPWVGVGIALLLGMDVRVSEPPEPAPVKFDWPDAIGRRRWARESSETVERLDGGELMGWFWNKHREPKPEFQYVFDPEPDLTLIEFYQFFCLMESARRWPTVNREDRYYKRNWMNRQVETLPLEMMRHFKKEPYND